MGGATRFIKLLSTPFPSLLLYRPSSLIFLRRLSSNTTTTTYTRYLTLSPFIKSFQQNLHIQPLKAHSPNQYSQPHPWAEWTHFISSLNYLQTNYVLNYGLHAEDAFVVNEENKLPDEFLRGAASCLAFARARPALLGLLSKRDIKTIMINGTPFLFKGVLDTARKMRDFLHVDGANVLESEKASTVDIMKYILSYASKPVGSSVGNSLFRRELVESSIRNLLRQIAQLSFGNVEQDMHVAQRCQSFGGYGQTTRPVGPHVRMKIGNWICPKCNFMNFGRNMKCLECEESRPKRQVVGREWECPQCNYFNFSKQMACLKCGCKRPGEVVSQSGSRGYNMDKTSMDRKSGENENKKNASKLDKKKTEHGQSGSRGYNMDKTKSRGYNMDKTSMDKKSGENENKKNASKLDKKKPRHGQSGSCGYNMDKTSMDRKSGENENKNNASKLDEKKTRHGQSGSRGYNMDKTSMDMKSGENENKKNASKLDKKKAQHGKSGSRGYNMDKTGIDRTSGENENKTNASKLDKKKTSTESQDPVDTIWIKPALTGRRGRMKTKKMPPSWIKEKTSMESQDPVDTIWIKAAWTRSPSWIKKKTSKLDRQGINSENSAQ